MPVNFFLEVSVSISSV